MRKRFLLLTSSLLVDRTFLYTDLLDTLSESGEVYVWAASAGDEQNSSVWKDSSAKVEHFPEVGSFPEFPHNYIRRLNEYVWDYRIPLASRWSMMRHVRDNKLELSIRILKFPARILAALRTERIIESGLEKLLLSHSRSDEAERRLRELRPSVVVMTGPFQFEQPAIFSAAKKLGIPTLAYIPSWDNVTTKNRMVFDYDGYLVWSEQVKNELNEVYPNTRDKPVYVVGASQYDVFKEESYWLPRDEFLAKQNLDPSLPVILYAIGSPNFLQEHHGAVEMAKRVANGELGDVQMLVRPHPIHDNAELHELFDRFAPKVRLQHTPNAGKPLVERTQDEEQITEWVNTFRHADVVINLSSTVSIDAALFDRPVVNLDFDPQPGHKDAQLIYEINHKWNHFKPVAESGGVTLVKDYDELVSSVKNYLEHPELHREKRASMVKYVCEFIDGKCGERMAAAIDDYANRHGSAIGLRRDEQPRGPRTTNIPVSVRTSR